MAAVPTAMRHKRDFNSSFHFSSFNTSGSIKETTTVQVVRMANIGHAMFAMDLGTGSDDRSNPSTTKLDGMSIAF